MPSLENPFAVPGQIIETEHGANIIFWEDTSETWMLAPSAGLKWINGVLHQCWASSHGNEDWKPVPTEEA